MSLPGGRGLRAAGGLRAAWERQQQAAQLAAVAGRIPHLASSKPAFFAAQLRPVLAALREAAAAQAASEQEEEASSSSEEEEAECGAGAGGTVSEQAERQHGGSINEWQQQQQGRRALAAAAAHLRRLMAVDRQPGANSALLLWLLLGLAGEGDGELLEGPLLLPLLTSLGWQPLLMEALPLLEGSQREKLERGFIAAATAAAAAAPLAGDAAAATQQLAAVQQLVARLAGSLAQQLEQYRSSTSSTSSTASTVRRELLACMELVQQLLLVGSAAATTAGNGATAALRQLQAAADASMAGLMQAMQQQAQQGAGSEEAQEEGQRAGQQAVFQQLCQLRSRLMLTFAASSAAADSGSGSGSCSGSGAASEISLAQATDSNTNSQPTGNQTWRAVLQMPPDVAAAAAAAAVAAGSAAAGSVSRNPSRQQFLAACVAARCYAQASPVAGSSVTTHVSSASGSAGRYFAPHRSIAALPGVLFMPPQGAASSARGAVLAQDHDSKGSQGSGSSGGLGTAAEAAAADLACDPGCLGPIQLVLCALQLAEQTTAGTAGPKNASWPLLLDLAVAAAGEVGDPAQRRQLLLLALHGQQLWQRRLRAALAADANLQQRCIWELVAVSNRLSADAGRWPATAVHGEARQRRTAAAVAALLPHALLCPEATLGRLLREALVQQGSQVSLLLDVLHEMRPLALYRQQGQEQPLLLCQLADMLARAAHEQQAQQAQQSQQHGQQGQEQEQECLQPEQQEQQRGAALDTPGSRAALLQLVAGLCRVPGAAAAAAAAAPTGHGPLLSPAAVMQNVVTPALERCQQQQQQQQQQGQQEGNGGAGVLQALQLPLQLAEVLLGCTSGGSSSQRGSPHTHAQQQEQQVRQQQGQHLSSLQPLLAGVLDFEARRVDRSAAALGASSDTYELAASIMDRLGGTAGTAGSTAGAPSAGAYLHQQLQSLLPASVPGLAEAQQQQMHRQQVQRLRRAMLRLLAALLPCCTAAEGREVLQTALPAVIQAALMPALVLPPPGSSSTPAAAAILPGAHAAAVEAACRAARALALHPDQAPLATECLDLAPAAAAGEAVQPSVLRHVAVERMLQHLTQHSVSLGAAAAAAAGAGASPPPPPLAATTAAAAAGAAGFGGEAARDAGQPESMHNLAPGEAQALALRCFRELCQVAAAVQPAGYDCATLQAGLLQLVRQQLVAAAAVGHPAAHQRQQQQHGGMLPAGQVWEQLLAAAGGLPEGRVRELVLLALEPAAV